MLTMDCLKVLDVVLVLQLPPKFKMNQITPSKLTQSVTRIFGAAGCLLFEAQKTALVTLSHG